MVLIERTSVLIVAVSAEASRPSSAQLVPVARSHAWQGAEHMDGKFGVGESAHGCDQGAGEL